MDSPRKEGCFVPWGHPWILALFTLWPPYFSRLSLSLSWRLISSMTSELQFVVVIQLLSCIWLLATPWTSPFQASLSFTTAWSLLKLMSIKLMMTSNHLILCCPLLATIFPSIRVFLSETALHIRWPNYWSFNFSISPSSEYSGLISFRSDWFDLLAVQGTLGKEKYKKNKDPLFQGINP